jgi:hypothetical protein
MGLLIEKNNDSLFEPRHEQLVPGTTRVGGTSRVGIEKWPCAIVTVDHVSASKRWTCESPQILSHRATISVGTVEVDCEVARKLGALFTRIGNALDPSTATHREERK